MSPRAYDLIGNVTAPAEIFPRMNALAKMVDDLRDSGYHDAAAETEELLDAARTFREAMQSRAGRLRRLWRAVENSREQVTDAGAARTAVVAASLAYRDGR